MICLIYQWYTVNLLTFRLMFITYEQLCTHQTKKRAAQEWRAAQESKEWPKLGELVQLHQGVTSYIAQCLLYVVSAVEISSHGQEGLVPQTNQHKSWKLSCSQIWGSGTALLWRHQQQCKRPNPYSLKSIGMICRCIAQIELSSAQTQWSGNEKMNDQHILALKRLYLKNNCNVISYGKPVSTHLYI